MPPPPKPYPYPPNPFVPADQRDTPLRPPPPPRASGERQRSLTPAVELPAALQGEVAGSYAVSPAARDDEPLEVTEDDVETGPRHEAVSTLHLVIQAHDELDAIGRETQAALSWALVRDLERRRGAR